MSSSSGSSSGGSISGSSNRRSSSSSEDSIDFPANFPLDLSVYDQIELQDCNFPKPPQADPNDPRAREFNSLYPLKWLVADPPVPSASLPPPVGQLRTQLQQAFLQNAKGEWKYVEYVPAWSDPDWGSRFIWTDDAINAGKDQMTESYTRPGFLQTQRPAMRPDDAALNPTEAAKRWGVYPWRVWNGLENRLTLKGWSGATPRMEGFPVVQLEQPRFSPDAGGLVDVVTMQDLSNERQRHDMYRRQQLGLETTDKDFEQALRDVSSDPTAGPIKSEKAASLLALLEVWQRKEERDEYQRLIFGGNTSSELVEQGVWTMGAEAFTDLANPLHDLVVRDKWARTDDLGAKKDKPRIVYNLSGKQGEYTAHDDTLWTALQPALQIVSQVLKSQHPATWVWADIRKLRPVEDSRRSVSNRYWKFYTSSDFGVDVPSLSGEALNWPEFIDICATGFDTTSYVCEILKRTIEWNIGSMWRIFGDDGDPDSASSRAFGTTAVERTEKIPGQPPFKIKIYIGAELVWPLLADEYSTAEKASSSMFVAATMLHELAHALVVARCQLFMPGTLKPGDEPLWLTLQPSWKQMIAEFNAQNNVDILDRLQTFGGRFKYVEANYVDDGLFFPSHEIFWHNDPEGEEGWATENQYFGGLFEPLPAASVYGMPTVNHFRFLEESTFITAMRAWATDPGSAGRCQIFGAIAMSEYQKLYSQTWWNASFVTYGSAALKMFNMGVPIRSQLDLRTRHVHRLWAFVEKRYGDDARDWLQRVWIRMQPETANQLLWRYLIYQTIVATEPEACERTWFDMQETWDLADLAVWNDRNAAIDSATALDTALNNASDRNLDAVFFQGAVPPVDGFRKVSASFWHVQSVLTREATYFQNVAVQFITLEDRSAKDKLFRQYAGRLRARVTLLYMRVITDIIEILDALDKLITDNPRITGWLTKDPDITQIWTRLSTELREKLNISSQFLGVVLGVFHEDPTQRIYAADQMGAIPSGAAQTLTNRVKRTAMRQYHALAPTDPRRRVADDWMEVLRSGDLLRNPAPNSPAAHFNQQLRNRVVGIDAGVAAHQQAVAKSHPDPQNPRHIGGSTALVNQQASAAGPFDRSSVTEAERQAAYALAVGFQPYRDAATGFTRFADIRAQQPNLGQLQGPTDAQLLNQQGPGQGIGSVERRIEHTAAQLQQMSHPQGQPIGVPTPAPNVFGAAAAQQGQAIQQIEGLVEQRAAMQNSMQTGKFTGSFPGPGPNDEPF